MAEDQTTPEMDTGKTDEVDAKAKAMWRALGRVLEISMPKSPTSKMQTVGLVFESNADAHAFGEALLYLMGGRGSKDVPMRPLELPYAERDDFRVYRHSVYIPADDANA